MSIISIAPEPTFSSNPSTPQKVRQVAKVTPFEKNEEITNETEDDNIAQEVFMLETNSIDSLDSPPINEIEDNDPLAGLESNDANNDIDILPEPRPAAPSGFGLRLANFAVDPANISAPETSASSTSNEQTWHIAQGVAPEPPTVPTQYLMPQSTALSALPLEPLPPQQVLSNYSTFVVQPPPQTNLTVLFPLGLLNKELHLCYPLLCNTVSHRSDYVMLTMHMSNRFIAINVFSLQK